MTTDERLDRIDNAIDRLFELHTETKRFLLDFRTETANRLDWLEKRLDIVGGNVAALEAKIGPYTKATEEFGASMTHIGRVLSQHTDANFDLATRVAKLEENVAKLMNPAA